MAEDLTLFAARLLRFDPAALIRLRDPLAWGNLPWGVLVCIPWPSDTDQVIAADLTARAATEWRETLPPLDRARAVEVLPAPAILAAAAAAAETLREVTETGLRGRPVGSRMLREALLDHQVITGSSDVDGTDFAISQRLVQAAVRMGFIAAKVSKVEIRLAGPWTGLATSMGEAWLRTGAKLTIRPIVNYPIGR